MTVTCVPCLTTSLYTRALGFLCKHDMGMMAVYVTAKDEERSLRASRDLSQLATFTDWAHTNAPVSKTLHPHKLGMGVDRLLLHQLQHIKGHGHTTDGLLQPSTSTSCTATALSAVKRQRNHSCYQSEPSLAHY